MLDYFLHLAMLLARRSVLIITFLSLWQLNAHAQYDSISSVTTTQYREDTIYWQELLIRNYYKGNLVVELREDGLNRDDIDYQMTTNFYDLNGVLVKTTIIEEERYECPPEPVSDWDEMHHVMLPTIAYPPVYGSDSVRPTIIPDSIPVVSRFCGTYSSKITVYSPYIHVTNMFTQYDERDTIFATDSLFFNRYGDETRQVTWAEGTLRKEYRYYYVYNDQGQMIEKRWENLTPGTEFLIETKYRYEGDRQLQTYYSSRPLYASSGASITRYYHDELYQLKKQENFTDDSLVSTHYYHRSENLYLSYTVKTNGDTTNISDFYTKPGKHGSESWTYQSIRSSSQQYHYSFVDTLFIKGGFIIESAIYKISKEEFEQRKLPKKSKRNLLHKSYKEFDEQNRLIRKKVYDRDLREEEYRYEYAGIH